MALGDCSRSHTNASSAKDLGDPRRTGIKTAHRGPTIAPYLIHIVTLPYADSILDLDKRLRSEIKGIHGI